PSIPTEEWEKCQIITFMVIMISKTTRRYLSFTAQYTTCFSLLSAGATLLFNICLIDISTLK
ncbi:hypothetical protein, partial [Providencia stuartii]